MSVATVAARLADRSVRDYPLVWVVGAGSVGISCDHQWSLSPLTWCVLLLGTLAIWRVLCRHGHTTSGAFALLLSVTALGGLWHHDRWSLYGVDELARFTRDTSTPICLKVEALDTSRLVAASEPSPLSSVMRGEMTRLAVRTMAVRDRGRWRPVSGRAQLFVRGRLMDVARGDRLRVFGFLQRTRKPANPGEPDYAAMARGRRRLCTVSCHYPSCVTRVGSGMRFTPLRVAGAMRCWAQRVLIRHVGSNTAPLEAALLLGSRAQLDRRTVNTFFVSGSLHVLAISGLHVGILASVFWLVLRMDWLPRPAVLWLAACFAMTYAAITGMRPPVMRATVLIFVYCLARGTYRRGAPYNALAAAGLVALILQPAGLRDVGTQLSFLAVATIIRIWPVLASRSSEAPLDRLIRRSRPMVVRAARAVAHRLVRGLALSSVVWLVTLPLVAARFHMVAPTAILLNLMLWFPVVVALFSGMLTLMAAVFLPPIAPVTGWICGQSLTVVQWLTGTAATLPGGHAWVAGPPVWWLLGFYGTLAATQLPGLHIARRWQIGWLALWMTVGLATGDAARRARCEIFPRTPQVTFASVGHGTSVLLELPDGRTLLYDAGGMGGAESAARSISALLWSRRISHLDAVVLSHADVDHFNALPTLVERFSVGIVYLPRTMTTRSTPALDALRSALQTAAIPTGTLREGERLAAGRGIKLSVLHPPVHGCRGGDNANSIVLLIECDGLRILLPGDLEGPGLEELLSELPTHCDVVMAPHHGSLNSDPSRITAWATPKWVVISGGAGDRSPRIQLAYGALGARVLHTASAGAIQIAVPRKKRGNPPWLDVQP